MSRSIDLFIDCDRPIEEVAAELSRLTGLALTQGSIPGTWSMEEGGVHADLRAHPYVADDDLPFDSYRYALSARVAQSIRTSDSAEASMLRLIGEALHRGGVSALLVHDLQYRERTGWGAGGPASDGGAAAAWRPAADGGAAQVSGAAGDAGGPAAQDAGAAQDAEGSAVDRPRSPGSGAPDGGVPDAGAAHAGAPEAVKPEAVKPGAVKPGAVKPEAVKPEAVKPGARKSGAAKRGAGEPAAGKHAAEKPAGEEPAAEERA